MYRSHEKGIKLSKTHHILVVLLAFGVVLLSAAGPASAAHSVTFATGGVGAGQLNEPEGVAVDQSTGDIYIAERHNDRISEFAQEGTFIRAFGWGVDAAEPKGELQTCTLTTGCLPGTGGSGPGQIGSGLSVAVEQPSHDIYVSEARNGRVQKFDPAGEFLLMFGKGVNETKVGEPGSTESEQDLCTKANIEAGDTCAAGVTGSGKDELSPVETDPIAIGASGDVWVGGGERLEEFSSEGDFIEEVPLAGDKSIAALATDTDPLSPSYEDFYTVKPATGGQDELQNVVPPESGTFTLTFAGETTTPIPSGKHFDRSTFESALKALPSIGHNLYSENCDSAHCEVEFIGALSFTDVEQMTASGGATVEVERSGEPQTPGEVLKFSRSGVPLGGLDEDGSPNAVGLDPATGDLFVSDQIGPASREEHPATLLEYGPSGAFLESFGTGGVEGGPIGNSLAFGDKSDALYVVDSGTYFGSGGVDGQIFFPPPPGPQIEEGSVHAEPVGSTTATLKAAINPEGAETTYHFEYVTERQFTEEGGFAKAVKTPESGSIGADLSEHPVSVAINGLNPETTYRFRVVATNPNAAPGGIVSEEVVFTTLPPALIGSESVSGVASTSATLEAQINPLGNETTYYFEYGRTTGYEDPAVPAPPGVSLGSGEGALPASVHLQGLAAGTTYHYRVVAVNALTGAEGRAGEDRAFTTQAAGTVVTQSDGRVWELVSPPNKQGAGFPATGGGPNGADIQAAADGGAITYAATAPIVPNPAGSRSPENEQVFSTRRGPGSWGTADITTAHDEGPSAVGHFSEYRLFLSDLSFGAVEPAGDTPLPPLPAGSEKTIYLREADGEYKALVTSGNVPEGVEFGGDEETLPGVSFVSASPDFKHVVLQSTAALVSGAPSGVQVGGEGGALYEWTEGQLQLVSVLPGNREAVGAQLGFVGNRQNGDVRGAISDDGSRIVWTTTTQNNSERRYYLRDMVKEETMQISSGRTGQDEFDLANSKGSRVFLTNSGTLGVFEMTSGQDEPLAGKTTELSGDVKGVIGASEDGSYVYFVAGDSIYVDRYDEATKAWMPPTLIAALSAGDAPTWGYTSTGEEEHGQLVTMTSRVSPNGRYLAFMSEASLTGYDNRDANSGVADEEVFLYHAPESPEKESGSLICASCDPTGARPVGVVEGTEEEPLWDQHSLWTHRWLAGSVPGWTPEDNSVARYQSRYLSNEGRLFFDSFDALVPADVDGQLDVYEYEPAGVGGCRAPGYGQSASVVYSEGEGGCVGLISSGDSSQESVFLDASETGGDVFFLTASRLSPLDYDTSYDVYDAHECTTAVPCSPPPALAPPACTTGDACKPAPTPQPAFFGAPSSETFSGAGNVVPEATAPPKKIVKKKTTKCARGKKPSHGRCVRRRPVKHAKKSDRTRGGK